MYARIKMFLMFASCPRSSSLGKPQFVHAPLVLIILPLAMLFKDGSFSLALGDCVVQRSSEEQAEIFQRHLSEACATSGGDDAKVSARDLIAAIQAGKSIDLRGVVIQGDLTFDDLQPLSNDRLNRLRLDRVEVKEGVKSDQVRLITQEISIHHSRFTGVVGTNLKHGDLIVQRSLSLADNIFEGPVDFSRTLFLADIDFSSSRFQQGGYFVQSRFHGVAQFDHGQFVERARYHKSHFYQSAHFSDVNFLGMAEFLEVLFQQDGDFTQTVFQLGAGFSGARFQGLADFSRGTFQREAFFLYTKFDQKALFTETHFQGPVTFDKSQFNGLEDFTSATFSKGSPFAKEPIRPPTTSPQEPLGPLVAYGIVIALFMAFGLKLLMDKRKNRP